MVAVVILDLSFADRVDVDHSFFGVENRFVERTTVSSAACINLHGRQKPLVGDAAHERPRHHSLEGAADWGWLLRPADVVRYDPCDPLG